MAIPAAVAHQFMADFCKDRIGIGMAPSLVNHLFQRAVASHLSSLIVPTKHEFMKRYVKFRASIDASGSTLALKDLRPGSPGLEVSNFVIDVEVLLGDNLIPMSTVRITIQKMFVSISRTGGDIRFQLVETPDYSTAYLSEPWKNYTDIEGEPFDAVLQEEWRIHQAGMMLGAPTLLGTAFANSLEFPRVLDAFYPLKINVNTIEITAENDFLIIAGEGVIDLDQCPYLPTDPPDLDRAGLIEGGPGLKSGDKIPGNDVPWPETGGFEPIRDASLFLYTPIKLLDVSFDGVLKPAVYLSDKFSFGPIYARYALTIALLQVKIDLAAIAPRLIFRMETRLKIHGDAGAGIEIAKIKWEYTAVIDGDIRSFISFIISLDIKNLIVHFAARFDGASIDNFDFTSGLGYPLDEVAGKLLQRALRNVIEDHTGKVLARSSVPIADLKKFKGFGKVANGLASAGDPDAATLGIEFRLD